MTTNNEATQEVESWDIKQFSASDVAQFIKDARARFKEEWDETVAANVKWAYGDCVVCKRKNVQIVQHWNDVGGPDTVQCEMCWVDGIVWFWMNEIALGDNLTANKE